MPIPMPIPTARRARRNQTAAPGRFFPRGEAAAFRFCGFAQKHAFRFFVLTKKRNILRKGAKRPQRRI